MAITYKGGNRIVSDSNSREALVNGNPNLIHHYKFGNSVTDSVGGVNGTVTCALVVFSPPRYIIE